MKKELNKEKKVAKNITKSLITLDSTRAMKRPSGQNIPAALRNKVKMDFIKAYVKHGIITRACDEIGISRSLLSQWEEHDEQFSFEYNQAKEKVNDIYREAARLRAVEGTDSFIVNQGKVVYVEKDGESKPLVEKKYSDALLMFVMKAKMPEYREKSQVDVTSNGQTLGQINLDQLISLQNKLPDKLEDWYEKKGVADLPDLLS